MGMGWEDRPGSLEQSRRRCSCGAGEVVEVTTYTEESEYPPFYRGEEYEIYVTCKNPECPDFIKYKK